MSEVCKRAPGCSTALLAKYSVDRWNSWVVWKEHTTLCGLCRGGDLCLLYSALSQDGKLVVEVIPLGGWGLCFGEVGGVISSLFGPVRGYHRMGPQCLLTPRLSLQYLCWSSLCGGGLGSVCYIWSTSPVISSVLCEFKYAPSFFLSLGGPEP